MRTLLRLIPLCAALAPFAIGQSPAQATSPEAMLVQRALANELSAAQDSTHPMRFILRKWSPRLTTTKEMIETRDGTIARLVAINDRPLDTAQEDKERARLRGLLANPGQQRHRQLVQKQDTGRALKVLRALPKAFMYQYAGPVSSGTTTLERFSFTPNPRYDPPDLETQALTELAGEVLIDPVSVRVVRLDGHLRDDVDFGWGILGRLYKGGWISIEQADVGDGVWRVVRFRMNMSARVVVRTRTFETTEEESHFAPVPSGLNYRQGVELLQGESHETAHR